MDSLWLLQGCERWVCGWINQLCYPLYFYNVLPISVRIQDFICKADDTLILLPALKKDLGHRRQSGKPWGWNEYKVGSWWGCWHYSCILDLPARPGSHALGCTGESYLSIARLEF